MSFGFCFIENLYIHMNSSCTNTNIIETGEDMVCVLLNSIRDPDVDLEDSELMCKSTGPSGEDKSGIVFEWNDGGMLLR